MIGDLGVSGGCSTLMSLAERFRVLLGVSSFEEDSDWKGFLGDLAPALETESFCSDSGFFFTGAGLPRRLVTGDGIGDLLSAFSASSLGGTMARGAVVIGLL